MAGIKLVECNKRHEYHINNTYCSRYRCGKSGNGKCKWMDMNGKKIMDLPPCTIIEGIWLPLEGLESDMLEIVAGLPIRLTAREIVHAIAAKLKEEK